jgi:hypothetical protein
VGKLYAKKSKGWGGRIVLILFVLALLGGAGYWYVVLRPKGWEYPWTPLLKRFASGAPAPKPAAAPAVTPVDSTTRRFDAASDSLSVAIVGFNDRAQRFGGRPGDCAALDSGLVVLEDAWTTYNQRQQNVVLDAPRATRDQQLASGADSSEATFERSGCARP